MHRNLQITVRGLPLLWDGLGKYHPSLVDSRRFYYHRWLWVLPELYIYWRKRYFFPFLFILQLWWLDNLFRLPFFGSNVLGFFFLVGKIFTFHWKKDDACGLIFLWYTLGLWFVIQHQCRNFCDWGFYTK